AALASLLELRPHGPTSPVEHIDIVRNERDFPAPVVAFRSGNSAERSRSIDGIARNGDRTQAREPKEGCHFPLSCARPPSFVEQTFSRRRHSTIAARPIPSDDRAQEEPTPAGKLARTVHPMCHPAYSVAARQPLRLSGRNLRRS